MYIILVVGGVLVAQIYVFGDSYLLAQYCILLYCIAQGCNPVQYLYNSTILQCRVRKGTRLICAMQSVNPLFLEK